jgi:outer membrane protein TolC
VSYCPLKFIFFAVLAILPKALGAQTPPLPATLPEDFLPELRGILYHAMQQSPQMVLQNFDLVLQEGNRYQAAALEWPSLSSSFGYVSYHTASSVGKTLATSSASSQGPIYAITLVQPIYHWGALQAAADVTHLQIKTSERSAANAYRVLATTIRSQYLALIAQKVQMHNIQYALNQAKASVAVIEERFKNHAASQGELDGANMQVDDASLAADRAAEDFSHLKRLFLLLTGMPDLSDDAVPDEIPKPIYSAGIPEALMLNFEQGGVDKTFQAQIYDYQIRECELNFKIAKYRLYPRIDLTFTLSEQYEAQAFALANNQTSITEKQFFFNDAAVSAGWNIFDGFATRGAKLVALANKRTAERNRQTYLDQTLEQARYLEHQIAFAAKAMGLTESRFEATTNQLQHAKDNLKSGVGSQTDVDQATATFNQWQLNAFSARIDFFSHWSDYLSLLGIDPVLNNLPARFLRDAE